ncbi:MAG: SPOR domain-containing protein [Pseudomonadota bacterium]
MAHRKHTATRRSGLALAPALLMLTTAPALADVKAGVDAWSRGEFAGAVKEWLGPAAKGDADAQFNMGQAFKLGKGVPQDTKRAEAWYRKAASQGHIKAADTLGLLMFQDGRKADALPFLQASAERGEPRAQYILGIAHFNGDIVGKDWVRAYALMSRAASAGLEQATRSLATMDGIVPLEQRQLAMSLSSELEQKAQENRSRQFAAADLGVSTAPTAPLRTVIPGGALQRADIPPSVPAPSGPVTAGADFANPVTMPGPKHISVAKSLPAKPVAAAIKPVAPAPKPVAPKPAVTTPAAKGNWRVQLGAFGVKANADGLWTKLRGRPELAGHTRIDLASGSVTRLLAGGFAGQAEADKACAALRSGGFTCLVVKP